MPLTKSPRPKTKYHAQAYCFVTDALSEAQVVFGREHQGESGGHISPRQLLEGVRLLGQRRFGMMTKTVFRCWGIQSTADIGEIVFEMIERGSMKKTETDQFSDFVDVFSFDDSFDADYVIDVSKAFKS